MKCEQSERYVLLEQSGELRGWHRRRVLAHVEVCERCRRYREDVLRITSTARESLGEPGPSGFALERIRGAARAAAQRRGRPARRPAHDEPFAVLWRPALVYATLAVLLLAGWFLVSRRTRTEAQARATPPARIAEEAAVPELETAWDGELDEQIAELDAMLAMVSADLSEAAFYPESTGANDVDSIATELLELEESS